MPNELRQPSTYRPRWKFVSRRWGMGQQGMPRVVAQRVFMTLVIRAYSEKRVKAVVDAIRWALRQDWDWRRFPHPIGWIPTHQDTLSDSESSEGGF